jgi:hypothetical protein
MLSSSKQRWAGVIPYPNLCGDQAWNTDFPNRNHESSTPENLIWSAAPNFQRQSRFPVSRIGPSDFHSCFQSSIPTPCSLASLRTHGIATQRIARDREWAFCIILPIVKHVHYGQRRRTNEDEKFSKLHVSGSNKKGYLNSSYPIPLRNEFSPPSCPDLLCAALSVIKFYPTCVASFCK